MLSRMLRLGLRCLRVAFADKERWPERDNEALAECEPGFNGLREGISVFGEIMGLVFVWAVRFGGFRDEGGFVLGLSVGGGSGSGVSSGKRCLLLQLFAEPLEGGDMGRNVCGKVMDGCRGLPNAGIDMAGGDGGGEGVVDVERKVGPRGVDAVEIGESLKGSVRSNG